MPRCTKIHIRRTPSAPEGRLEILLRRFCQHTPPRHQRHLLAPANCPVLEAPPLPSPQSSPVSPSSSSSISVVHKDLHARLFALTLSPATSHLHPNRQLFFTIIPLLLPSSCLYIYPSIHPSIHLHFAVPLPTIESLDEILPSRFLSTRQQEASWESRTPVTLTILADLIPLHFLLLIITTFALRPTTSDTLTFISLHLTIR
jgi:hypothetical protein